MARNKKWSKGMKTAKFVWRGSPKAAKTKPVIFKWRGDRRASKTKPVIFYKID